MNVIEAGDPGGPPLVLLHGATVAGWMWGPQVPHFGDHRVLVPDLPGFGASSELEWRSIAETADALAEVLPVGSHVVGLSLGASVAIELAARHPDRVASLMLASGQFIAPRRVVRALGRLQLAQWERRAFWRATARAYGLRGDDAELLVTTGLGIRRATAERIFDEVCLGTPTASIGAIAVPTLAVAGERDRGARASLRALPHAVTAIAPRVGHQWNLEGAELFNRVLRTWLESRAAHPDLKAITVPE